MSYKLWVIINVNRVPGIRFGTSQTYHNSVALMPFIFQQINKQLFTIWRLYTLFCTPSSLVSTVFGIFLKNSDFWNNVIMKLRNRWNKIHFPIRQSIRRFLPSLRRLIHMCGSFKRRRQIYFQFHSDVFDTMRKNHNDTRIWDHISWHVTIFTLKDNNCLFAFSGFTLCNFWEKWFND